MFTRKEYNFILHKFSSLWPWGIRLRCNNREIFLRLGSHIVLRPTGGQKNISGRMSHTLLLLCVICCCPRARSRSKGEREGTHCASACNLFFSDMLLCGSQDQQWWKDLRWTWRVSWINKEEGLRWRCWLKIKRPEASFLCLDWCRECWDVPGRLSEGSSVRAGLI